MNTKATSKQKDKQKVEEPTFKMPPGYDWITGFTGGGQGTLPRQLPEHKGINLKKK